jgi:uncharacterized SAM-binding protein YcdF (DUF218 family)
MIVAQSPERFPKIRKSRRWLHLTLLLLAALWLIAAGWLAAPLVWLAEAGVQPVAAPLMQGRTALILLGAGTQRRDGALVPKHDGSVRIDAVAGMYQACLHQAQHCTLIVSGGDPQHHGASEADTYAPYLIARGVAPGDLQRETRSLNTYQNAEFTVRLLQDTHYDAILLMTSRYHLHRALLDFEHFGAHPQPVALDADTIDYGWVPRLHNLKLAAQALHEVIGIAQFYGYRLMEHN